MMLEVTIGEHVAVRFDDEITDQRATPEVTEDYLTRMARTAFLLWDRTTDNVVPVAPKEDES